MGATRFFRLQLRTNDVEDARSFYDGVFGPRARDIAQLGEHAVARGARPHWLGYLHVDDVDDAMAAFVKRGGTALGRKWVTDDGTDAAVVREPGGAVVALAERPVGVFGGADQSTDAVWYQLNTIDVDRAIEDYRSLFGWFFGPTVEHREHGVFHPFAWKRGDPFVGWMTDILRRPGRHPHWLFHFRVAALAPALDAVRRGGGYVMGPFDLGAGEHVAVCDDSQSAAFAIRS